MRYSNLYTFTRTTYEENPPSCGGNWERGKLVLTAMSRSPKLARELGHRRGLKGPDCIVTHRHEGVDGVPVWERITLKRGSKVIFDRLG